MPVAASRRGLAAAATVALSAGCLLCGYEFLRSTSSTLFKTAHGSANLPIIMALTPPVVVLMLYAYGRVLSVLGPRRTLLASSLASGGAILACYFVINRGSHYDGGQLIIPRRSAAGIATGVLYLLRESYVVLILEQYWSFLNSHVDTGLARKLNGPVCGIASLGAIAGGWLVGLYSRQWGTPAMAACGAAAILPAALIAHAGYLCCGEPRPDARPAQKTDVKTSDALGLRLFKSNPVLTMMLVMILSTQIISTVLDLSLNTMMQEAMPNADVQNAWSGQFYSLLNTLAAIGQFVAAPLLLWLAPLSVIHLLGPAANFCACGYFLVSPSLSSVAVAYMSFKVFDYSIFRAAKEILYIPLSFDARFRAKELIDVFGYRAGKGGTSAMIALLRACGMAVGSAALAGVALCASALWLALAPKIAARHDKHAP
jgi:ATP/ADP translocase